MTNEELVFLEKTESGAPGPAIRFESGHERLDWQRSWESVFPIFSETRSGLKVNCDCSNWVVHASRPSGTHRHHAMQCQQFQQYFNCPGASLLCSNSWGDKGQSMTIPDRIFPRIVSIWVLSVHGVQVLPDKRGSVWGDVNLQEDRFNQMIQMPHVGFLLSRI